MWGNFVGEMLANPSFLIMFFFYSQCIPVNRKNLIWVFPSATLCKIRFFQNTIKDETDVSSRAT